MSKTVWLTGGSSGIGAYLCRSLIEEGYRVINFARRASPVDSVINFEVDLADPAAAQAAFKQAAAT